MNNCKRCDAPLNSESNNLKFCEKCRKEKRAEYYKNWYNKNGRKRTNTYSHRVLEWKLNNPEKVEAHKKVASALKSKILKNPGECSSCRLKTSYLDAHHEDYSKPLEVVWLCPTCHRKIHSNKNKGE